MSNGTARVGGVVSLRKTTPDPGRVAAILVRPGRREPPVNVDMAEIEVGFGLKGDHFAGGVNSKRQVTLIAEEDLMSIASFLGLEKVAHESTRRNILTRGINLLALKNRTFRVGTALLEYTGQCSPCSLMEKTISQGAYQAMRYRGGIIARVLEAGTVCVGDIVSFEAESTEPVSTRQG